jgi:putative transposase
VHYDPYDVTRIWVRNHHDGGWITSPWTHLKTSPVPFGEQAWAQAQQIVARRGDPATETEIADAVTRLLDRAEQGPDAAAGQASNKRDRRVAARTRATSGRTYPRPVDPDMTDDTIDTASSTRDVTDEARASESTDDGLAKVIPLAVFDARDEAKRWW